MEEITVCFLADGSKEATALVLWLDLGEIIDCLLFFNLAETVGCFFIVDLGGVADFFCVVSLVVAIVSFLLADFDVTGAFLVLGLALRVDAEFFLLSGLV
ncbi:hypothetical protein [Methylobacter tundripaludum]|uniref:hypothetical protein n=1 Tax=Methylobacter tundripaludum TaxID=173365 RepID=UPI0020B8E537|nr:hypothetical protein [Methylobacter tundripaludum]